MYDTKKFYDINSDFKRYVDKYMESRHISQDKLAEVLQHVLVKNYAQYIIQESMRGTAK